MDNVDQLDDAIVIRSATAKWPCLTKRNRRYNKYTVAIELDKHDSKELSDLMDFALQKYFERNEKSSEMPVAPNFEQLDDGRCIFNLQNREEPELLSKDGKPFVGEIGEGSTLNLAVDLIPYTNNANGVTGVSIRVIGVEVVHAIRVRRSVRELFGHPAANDTENQDEDWSEWDNADNC